jgi:hypothetical protein
MLRGRLSSDSRAAIVASCPKNDCRGNPDCAGDRLAIGSGRRGLGGGSV